MSTLRVLLIRSTLITTSGADVWQRLRMHQSCHQSLRKRKIMRACCGEDAAAAGVQESPGKLGHRGRNQKWSKAFSNSLGCVIGDILGSSATGETFSALHSLQLGLSNSLLDLCQKPLKIAAKNPATPTRSTLTVASSAALDPFWMSASACLLFAVLKLVHGQPAIVLSSCQDKLLSMMVANHVLWPLARSISASMVPQQHQAMTNILIHTVWSACLSSLGHAPSLMSLARSAPQLHHLDNFAALSNLMPEEAFPTAAQAMYTSMECAVTPVLDQAAQALDSATDMLDSLPSALLQEVLSSTLDLTTPARKLVKRPSQLQNAGAVSEHELGGVDMDALE
ncbi:TPA: hypothetical protein ACH3X2_001121 [Trebouxia sp. C0005]